MLTFQGGSLSKLMEVLMSSGDGVTKLEAY
jgi:hypothetical protein